MSRFVVLDWEPGEYAAEVTVIENVEDDFELLRGVPRLSNWPKDATFRMDDDFPDDVQLEDVMRTGQRLILASERLKTFLAERAPRNNEFLPVVILNHKGRRVREPYWIVHQIHLQACIDEARSSFDVNDINPELILDIERLVVDDTRVPSDVRLFRMARYPLIPVLDRSLADEIGAAGFSGMRFDPLDDYAT
jgi:hypothetical protein